jgi:AcrR family transcriptional regulator
MSSKPSAPAGSSGGSRVTGQPSVSDGSRYHHFESKGGVLVELIVRAIGGYQDGLFEVLDAHRDDALRRHPSARSASACLLALLRGIRRPSALGGPDAAERPRG